MFLFYLRSGPFLISRLSNGFVYKTRMSPNWQLVVIIVVFFLLTISSDVHIIQHPFGASLLELSEDDIHKSFWGGCRKRLIFLKNLKFYTNPHLFVTAEVLT